MKKILITVFLCIVLVLAPAYTVSAASEQSFNRVTQEGGTTATIASRAVFSAVKSLSGKDLGTEKVPEGLSDVFVAADGNIYLLAANQSEILVLDADYRLLREITVHTDSFDYDLTGAMGVYADSDGTIYVADTANARILKTTAEGLLTEELLLPESDAIPEGFIYQPSKIIRDSEGYTYVLSYGCYYGALVYAPNGEFTGFLGANTVAANVLDALEMVYDTLFNSDTKKSGSVRTLPYSFLDFTIGEDGYLVTCTGSTETTSNGSGQIRKVSQSGANILFSVDSSGDAASSTSFNFLEEKVFKQNNIAQTQNIVAVDVDAYGNIYALDQTYGLIYVYDTDCNLITGFGGGFGEGDSLGVFVNATSLAVNGTDVLVTDSKNNSLTIFSLTEFGRLVMQADSLYLAGNYEEAEPYCRQVLQQDSGNQLAYRGLAMTAYNRGEYREALSLAKKACDYSVYDMAYQNLFTGFVAKYFVFIALFLIAIIAGAVAFSVRLKRQHLVLVTNTKVRTALSAPFHPFAAFGDIKNNGQGSFGIALLLLAFFFVITALQQTASGFLFREFSAATYNILYPLAKTVGLVVLWVIANWLMATLMTGKGKMMQVFVCTMYALIPYLLLLLCSFALSWVLPLSGAGFLTGLETVGLLYSGYLLIIAMMQIHEFDFFKFLLCAVLTVLAMIFIVFLIFMIVILLQQFWNLIYSVFMEVFLR